MNTSLTVQMIVKNEDQWVWYAIASVIDYAESVIIYDTGSRDRTVEIIKSFPQSKIIFEEKGAVDSKGIVILRQEQLERTKTDWFLIVDGDEVWPKESIKKLLAIIQKYPKKSGIVVRARMCLGDIQHYQDDMAGEYAIAGKKGHLNIRAYRKIPGYLWKGVYPNEAYVDQLNIPIQNKEKELSFINTDYWHLRHLPRSTIFKNPKRKLELGEKIDRAELPEVFLLKRPSVVPAPWVHYSSIELIFALITTPLRKLKRNLL